MERSRQAERNSFLYCNVVACWRYGKAMFAGARQFKGYSGLLLWVLSCGLVGSALADSAKLAALKQMSINDLANLEISVASGRPERFGDTAAAVFVITAEDIRRSGATSLPEVLRMVPGLAVGRIDASSSAVSSRGFQTQGANKLLVLIDGRSIYNALFSGVYWESYGIVLQDIERIEVVRGPGAVTWGANAVNGVINIITKRTEETQGTYIGTVAGDKQRQLVARQGGRLGEQGTYRLYAKLHRDDPLPIISGADENGVLWKGGRVGFRADRRIGDDDLMLEGETFREAANANDYTGRYLFGRWEQRKGDGAIGTLQAYYNRIGVNNGTTDDNEDTFDLSYRWSFAPVGRHTFSVGGGYRWIYTDIKPGSGGQIRNATRDDQLFSAFIQDDIQLDERLYLTLGTKLEHNSYTGFEVQPSARLRWLPSERQTLWAAVSRAVRTPSRAEHDMTLTQYPGKVIGIPGLGNVPLVVTLIGNPEMVSEELIAYEVGYRWQATSRLTLDAALFLNDYDQLRTFELTGPPSLSLFPAPALVQQATADNKDHGRTYGLELAADFRPYDWWRLQGAYSFLHMNIRPDADSTDNSSAQIDEQSPMRQWTLRSSLDIRDDVDLDLWLRYVANIPTLAIDPYLTIDARLGWKINAQFDLALVGRNLLNSPHVEYKQFAGFAQEPKTAAVEREVYLMAEWRF